MAVGGQVGVVAAVVMQIVLTILKAAVAQLVTRHALQFVLTVVIIQVEAAVVQVALLNVKTEAIILVAETHVTALALTIAMKSVQRDVREAVKDVAPDVVNRPVMMDAIRNVIGLESLEAVLAAYQHVRIIAVILAIGIVITKYKAKWKI